MITLTTEALRRALEADDFHRERWGYVDVQGVSHR